MYSLYRAWLSMSTQPPELPPLNLSAPTSSTAAAASSATTNAPDVQLQVGPALTNFSAHRNVLAAHSGFFKAALNNFVGAAGPIGPILVPNIAVDEFSSLLTFMYTGYLDLNLSNIYNILLATHILHMPRALELCRNFLMQQQQQQIECPAQQQQPQFEAIPAPVIIKPIASRKPLPHIDSLCEKTRESEKTRETEKKIFKNSVFKAYKNTENSEDPQSEPSTSSVVIKPENKPEKATKKDKKRRISNMVAQAACAISEEQRVIVDIACCDGPVRFHRIVNKNYGRKTSPIETPKEAASGGGGNNGNNGEDETLTRQRTSTLAAINKIMTENIKLASVENNETPSSGGGQPAVDLYTCLYCNHTFKSQYCYQKHARRHLNPVDAVKTPIETPAADKSSSTSNCAGGTGAGVASKREFKLLDMNVQYYPCKTCGSKFPSYYFVHKHRKLCHADEMADGSNKNNEIVQVKPKKSKSTTLVSASCSTSTAAVANVEIAETKDAEKRSASEEDTSSDIIDVEETN